MYNETVRFGRIQVRVIAGAAGGLKLTAPAGNATRPTADRVKEALFSILEGMHGLADTQVLDLFAGSGALGIEALSRGAAHATLVDKSRPALAALRNNLLHTNMAERATVLALDVFTSIEHLLRHKARFDLIFLDPPYALGVQRTVLERLGPLLAPTGLIVAEAASRDRLPEQIGPFHCIDRRVYGDTALEFFATERNDAP